MPATEPVPTAVPTESFIADAELEARAEARMAQAPQFAPLIDKLMKLKEDHRESFDHSLRVGEVMAATFTQLVSDEGRDRLTGAFGGDPVLTVAFGGYVEDIGKGGENLPSILDKPDATDAERLHIRQRHVKLGLAILDCVTPHFESAADQRALRMMRIVLIGHHLPFSELSRRTFSTLELQTVVLGQTADQIDARTSIDRSYVLGAKRPNPGVTITDTHQIIEPGVLLPAVLGAYGCPDALRVFGQPAREVVGLAYRQRFGTKQPIMRPLPQINGSTSPSK